MVISKTISRPKFSEKRFKNKSLHKNERKINQPYSMCGHDIHLGLIDMNHEQCLFCDEVLIDKKEEKNQCCDQMEICNTDDVLVCIKCYAIEGYNPASEFFNFL